MNLLDKARNKPVAPGDEWPRLNWLALVVVCGASGLAAAATLRVNPGGTSGCKSTIGAAVTAASPGDTIRIAPGTYKEQVTITKPLSLAGLENIQPVIDATGRANGISSTACPRLPT